MEPLKERFLKVYANIPINLRDEIILVLKDYNTITWNVAYLEVKVDTELGGKILKELEALDLI